MKRMILVCMTLCLLAGLATAAQFNHLSSSLETWQTSLDIAIEGNLAYIATGYSGLRIVDIDPPNQPAEIGAFPTKDWTRSVAVLGSYCYLVNPLNGVQIVDVTNPSSPEDLGTIQVSGMNHPRQLLLDPVENRLFVVDERGLFVFSLQDPAAPSLLGSFSSSYTLLSADLEGSRVAAISYGLAYIFDIDGAGVPDSVGSVMVDPGQLGTGVALDDSLLFIVESTNAISVTNITDLTSPQQLDKNSSISYGGRLFIDRTQDLLYVPVAGGVLAIDYSTPSTLMNQASFQDSDPWFSSAVGNAVALDASGNVYCTFDAAGLMIMDAALSQKTGHIRISRNVSAVEAISGSTNLAVGDAALGLVMMDMSDPTTPTILSETGISETWASDLDTEGNYAYLGGTGFAVVDITDPSSPVVKRDTVFSAVGIQSLCVDDQDPTRVWIGSGNGFYPVDVSDPVNPVLGSRVGGSSFIYGIFDMAMSGSRLVGAVQQLGFIVYDTNSGTYDMINTMSGVNAIAIRDTIAYTAGTSLKAFSVNDVTNVFEIQSNIGLANATSLHLAGERLYAASTGMIHVYDISDPANPSPVIQYGDVINTKGIAAVAPFCYVANQYSLVALELDESTAGVADRVAGLPGGFAIQNLYPNPFNPSLTAEITMPEAAPLTVTVYNALGREVARLADGFRGAGVHTMTFDATRLASGVYFIRASVPGAAHVRRVVLMR